jgi:hypothetical protein
MSSSWKKLGINKKCIEGCADMAYYALTENQEKYWGGCKAFLVDIQHIPYEALSVKQKNYAFNIKSDLKKDGKI